MKHARANPPAQLLATITPTLNEAQKLFILLDMVDGAMAYGEAEAAEQALCKQLQASFGMTKAALLPHFHQSRGEERPRRPGPLRPLSRRPFPA